MAEASTHFIYRQCITLRNGKRLCRPPGQAFRIPIKPKTPHNDNDKPDDSTEE